MRQRVIVTAIGVAAASVLGSFVTGCGGDSKTSLYSKGGAGGVGASGGAGLTGGTTATGGIGVAGGGAVTSGGNGGTTSGGSAGATGGGAGGAATGGTAGATSGGTAGTTSGGTAGSTSGGTAGTTGGGAGGATSGGTAGTTNGGAAGSGTGGATGGTGGATGGTGGATGGTGGATGGSGGTGGTGGTCGNGQLDAGEQCDAGSQNGVTGSGCTTGCQYQCQLDADCADTNACNGAETCVAVSGGKTCQSGTPVASLSCYSGAASELTAPKTACKAGISYCVGGTAGQCTGEVLPTPESCNGIDDNCDGSIDEGLGTISCGLGACATTAPACVNGKLGTCTPKAASAEVCGDNIDNDCNGLVDDGCNCVHVAPAGNDTTGTGSATAPFKTIAYAISVAGTNNLPTQVCVASGPNCPSNANYNEAVTMRDGISVLGGYRAAGATWARVATCVTTIPAQDGNGVVFGHSITSYTQLDGFTVTANNSSTNAAITVTGSTAAVISNDIVMGGGGNDSVGILVQDSGGVAATPTIRSAAVTGGTGSTSAIGILSVNSAPIVSANCDTITAGRCATWGCFATTNFIRGRTTGNTGGNGSETYGIRLENSPNTVIDTSSICSSDGRGDVAGIRISGAAAGTVIERSNISAPALANANVNAVGVWMDACGGDSPWIFDNYEIQGQSRTVGGRADGVRAVGDCHPRIDSNNDIVGGVESAANDAIGVYCARDAATGASSRCTVLGNTAIRGSGGGFPPTAAGVKCDAGACARIEKNANITGNSAQNAYGVILNGASTFLDSNVISSGCATVMGIGIQSIDSSARVQNNIVRGVACAGAVSTAASYGVQVLSKSAGNEFDLHSNDLFGGGFGACTSRGLAFDVVPAATAPTAPLGVIRNNIIDAGGCNTASCIQETLTSTDPRIVENNDLWTVGTALYRNEGTTNLTTIAAVNALTDITVSGNISADPAFLGVGNYHLTPASPCANTGTAAGAPATDWEAQARPAQSVFDIGADEYVP